MQEADYLDRKYRDLYLAKENAVKHLKTVEKQILDFAFKHPDYTFQYAIPVQPSTDVDWKKLEKIFEIEQLRVPLKAEYKIDVEKAIQKLKDLDEEIPQKRKTSIDKDRMKKIAEERGIEIPMRISRRGYVRKKKETPEKVF